MRREELGVDEKTVMAITVATVLFAVNPFLMRRTGRVRPSCWIAVVSLYVAMTVAPVLGAGVEDASLWWSILVPLLAGFLLVGRAAVGFGVLVMVQFWVLFWADTLTGAVGQTPPADVELFITLCGSTATATLTLLTIGYERSRVQARDLLDDKMRELEAANLEVTRLSASHEAARVEAECSAMQKERFLGGMGDNAALQGGALENATAAMTEINASLGSVGRDVGSLEEMRGAERPLDYDGS